MPLGLGNDLMSGSTVGRYVILGEIARGGMGVIYAAYDTQLDRKLAIKLLRPDYFEEGDAPEVEARLLREAQAMARVTHPNVAAVHDVGTHDGRVFLAMEFVDGITLKQWLKTPRPFRDRLRTVCDAGRGLAAAHACGVVHRDVKPDNILVEKDGRVVVVDFGLARRGGEISEREAAVQRASLRSPKPTRESKPSFDLDLTLTGSILGTVGFLAPEQALDGEANEATDQFSFAATLYFALYGVKPFPNTSLQGYLEETALPPKPPQDVRDVPSWVQRAVLRGLRPTPEERFPSISSFLETLERDPYRPWRWGAATVAVIGLLAAGVTGAQRQRALVCAADPLEFASVWNDHTRKATHKAFSESGVAWADESAERLTSKLDTFSRQWVQAREDVCRATKIKRQQSEEVLRLRNDCLDRARMEVQALVALLVHADATLVKRTISVAYGLPELSWCSDVAALRASTGLPDDPGKRARAVEVRATLAEGDALSLAGRAQDAVTLAKKAVELARALDDRSTTAETLFSYADRLASQGQYEAMLPHLNEAMLLAVASGRDATVVEIARLLAFVHGPKLQHAAEAKMWLSLARATLFRIGGNDALELRLTDAEASVMAEVDWRPELAVALDERVVEGNRRVHGVHPKTVTALYNLGVDWAYLGEPARGRPYFEQSLEMAEQIGGPLSDHVARSLYMLGEVLAMTGEFQRADEMLNRAISIFEQTEEDYWGAQSCEALAWAKLMEGDMAAAAHAADAAVSHLGRAKRPSVLVPIIESTAGFIFAKTGRAAVALPLCEEALSEQERTKAIDSEKLYAWDALRCKGVALAELGRSLEAVPLLERSLTLKRRMFPGDYARSQFALARALVETGGDASRALSLAAAARDGFASSPFLAAERSAVESWLAVESARPRRGAAAVKAAH